MKKEDLELIYKDIEQRKPIRVIFGGDDFGVYEWNEETQRYEDFLGFTIKELIKIIKTPNHFIKIERVIYSE